FAGLALGVLPWLIGGGTLLLHHGFDQAAFAEQCSEQAPDTIVLPARGIEALDAAELLSHKGLRRVIAAWRSPERMGRTGLQNSEREIVDVAVFGEMAICVCDWAANEQKPVFERTIDSDNIARIDFARTRAGALSVRGPMVPTLPYPPDAKQGYEVILQADVAGFVDTGYPCRIEDGKFVLSGPIAGLIDVGGYRFAARRLQETLTSMQDEASLVALPHPLLSHRLAGTAVDAKSVHAALAADGVN